MEFMSPQASICTADLHEGFVFFIFVFELKEEGNHLKGLERGTDTATVWGTGGVWSLL